MADGRPARHAKGHGGDAMLCCTDGTAYNVIVLKGEDNYVVTDTEGNLYLPLDEIVEYAKKLDEAREKVNEAMQHIETEENEKVPALVG